MAFSGPVTAEIEHRHRVLLLSMPASSLHYPSIGLSLLKPALEAEGADVRIRYEFLRFADMIGAENQALLDEQGLYHALLGEWIFAAEAHGTEPLDLDYVSDVLQARFGRFCSLALLHAAMRAREIAGAFLDACLAAVERDAPAIVGFTSSFQQNCASLALARRIKSSFPETVIVFGGANCRGTLGLALLETYAFIDAVCIDEGDRAFPAYVRRLASGSPPAPIPGIAERPHARAATDADAAEMIHDLDALPYPDFSDFFAQHAASAAATAISRPTALFETSRGCWWGQKHHCTFCGINGNSMPYRSKSQPRAYREVAHLASRFGADLVNVDAILDYRYFEEFLPRLGRDGPRITAYYELKANITSAQLTVLSRAGIKKIQPGIESLDTEVLKLMRKGCTTLQNVQLLKLAAENGLFVEWNLLHGFPGETAASYRRIAAIIPKLLHLQPPGVCGPVRADRFSPYWARPESFGIAITPNPAYRHIYPFAPETVARLAYHFDIVVPRSAALDEAVAAVVAGIAAWRTAQPRSSLALSDHGGDGLEITDRRAAGRPHVLHFAGRAAALLRACWQAVPWTVLVQQDGDADALRAALEELEALGLVLVEGDRVLTLALRQPGYAAAPDWSDIRAGRTVPFTLGGSGQEPAPGPWARDGVAV
jgi:ribosomal peptide maturation radical SAM protein 1